MADKCRTDHSAVKAVVCMVPVSFKEGTTRILLPTSPAQLLCHTLTLLSRAPHPMNLILFLCTNTCKFPPIYSPLAFLRFVKSLEQRLSTSTAKLPGIFRVLLQVNKQTAMHKHTICINVLSRAYSSHLWQEKWWQYLLPTDSSRKSTHWGTIHWPGKTSDLHPLPPTSLLPVLSPNMQEYFTLQGRGAFYNTISHPSPWASSQKRFGREQIVSHYPSHYPFLKSTFYYKLF